MLSYLFNFVPWWLWVLLIALAAGISWQFWGPIWMALPRPAKTALATLGALIAVYVMGRNKGSRDERDQAAKRDARATQTRKEIEDEIRDLPDDDVDRRLDRWMRRDE